MASLGQMSGTEGKLRYSERKRLAEEGTLGDLQSDVVPVPPRVAVSHFYNSVTTNWVAAGGRRVGEEVIDSLVLHFGMPDDRVAAHAISGDVDALLDFREVFVEVGSMRRRVSGVGMRLAVPGIESQSNRLCERHRFGFRLNNDEAVPISPPALDRDVVGPAPLAASRPGWQKVEEDYREALDHLRGEVGLAINSAHAAMESALKPLGFNGAALSDLHREFRKSDAVPGYLASGLDQLSQAVGKLTPLRGTGEAHGQAPDAEEPPREFAAPAIHMAGAFIVFLSEAAASDGPA